MNRTIRIHSKEQRLYFDQGDRHCSYLVSTGKNGMGEQEHSEKTPRGWHEIAEKIGQDAPQNAVFIAREPTGEIYSQALAEAYPGRDWILTRILRLRGLESGRNQGPGVDSFQRYIYIHGTPDTTELGRIGSRGCIRMHNKDIIELFNLVTVGTKIFID